jgi:hypothetical protein
VHLAAGFLVFLAGETLILSGSAMELTESAPSFAAGAGLWSAAMALVSASPTMPRLVRVSGAIASILFALTAAQIFGGFGLDGAIRAVAILRVSIPGRHAVRMGVGAQAVDISVRR